MKKSGILIIMILLLLSGCAKKDDIFSMYQHSIKKNAELTSAHTVMEMDLQLKMSDHMKQFKLLSDMQYDDLEKVYIKKAVESDFTKLTVEEYYVEDYVYLDVMGRKMKTMANDSMLQQELEELSHYENNYTSEMFEDARLTKHNGKRNILIPLSEKFDQLGEKILNQINLNVLKDSDILIRYDESTLCFVLNEEGYIEEQNIVMPIDVESAGTRLEMVASSSLKLIDPGKTIDIVLPDLSEFKEVSELSRDELIELNHMLME